MEGGKVLGSGTYGCILKPALPCKGETERKPDTVSKLMRKYDANDEMMEINNIYKRVKLIPNNQLFYIISDVRICELGKVTDEDLEGFDKNCHAMKRNNITKQNVQYSNSQLRLLQLPDGGKDITHYFGNSKKSFDDDLFIKVNSALVKLLEFGIAPLKTVQVLHEDIKAQNIVYSEKNDLARLIDWGLATVFIKDTIPSNIRGWPITFNQPFTTLVFNKHIQRLYKSMFKTYPKIVKIVNSYKGLDLIRELLPNIQVILLGRLLSNYDDLIYYLGSAGHFDYLDYIVHVCSSLESDPNHPIRNLNSDDYLSRVISQHLALAFLHFSLNSNGSIGRFDEVRFFNEVYKINCDVFGFLSTYTDIITNKSMPLELRKKTYETIIKPFYFESDYAYNPYNVTKIANACLHLNNEYVIKSIKLEGKRESFDEDIFTWSLRKRCPRGSRRDKKTQKCVKTKKILKVKPQKTLKVKKITPRRSTSFSWPKSKRCPRGSRRDKKTQKCVKNK